MLLNDFQYLHIDQSTENNGFLAILHPCVIDLTHRLVGLVHRVDKGQPHGPRAYLKLGKNCFAKGFCGNAGAVRDKENTAMGHVELF